MGLPCGHSIGVVEKAFIIQLLTPSSVPREVGVCLSVCLSVSWLVNWSIVLSACRVYTGTVWVRLLGSSVNGKYRCLSVSRSVCLSICLSVCLSQTIGSVNGSACVCLSVCLSVYLRLLGGKCTCLSVCLSVTIRITKIHVHVHVDWEHSISSLSPQLFKRTPASIANTDLSTVQVCTS